jgi:hypothetical protein
MAGTVLVFETPALFLKVDATVQGTVRRARGKNICRSPRAVNLGACTDFFGNGGRGEVPW